MCAICCTNFTASVISYLSLAKEVILSHMITFLNEKNNWELHLAFFDAIVDVATQIGHRSLDIVEALLQQVRLNMLASQLCIAY